MSGNCRNCESAKHEVETRPGGGTVQCRWCGTVWLRDELTGKGAINAPPVPAVLAPAARPRTCGECHAAPCGCERPGPWSKYRVPPHEARRARQEHRELAEDVFLQAMRKDGVDTAGAAGLASEAADALYSRLETQHNLPRAFSDVCARV